MTPRFVPLCLAVLFAVASSARAQTPAPTRPAATAAAPANPDTEMINELKLPDADIDTVLSTLEMLTGRTVLRPAALQTATYNLKISRPLPKSDAILYIETVLALNNIGVSPLGDHALVVSQLQATRYSTPEMITGSAFDLPPSGKIATKIFLLDFMRVAEFIPMLQQGILNPNLGPPVQLQGANAALVTDSVSNLQRIEALLKLVDKPNPAGLTPKFYPLHNANATALVGKLNGMFGGTLRQQLGQNLTFNADDRTNQIVLFADPRQYPTFDDLIEKLDAEADPQTRNDVIYLKHAKALDVVTTLQRIISGQTTAAQRANSQSVRPGQGIVQPVNPAAPPGVAPAPTPAAAIVSAAGASPDTSGNSGSNEFSSFMTVANDDRSNSVVVSGTRNDIRLIKDLIEKLDVVLAQVRIEVVIAEVTLDDNHTSGISALGLQLSGDRLVGFTGTAAGIGVAGSATGNTTSSVATISPLGGPGSLGRSLDLSGFISLSTTPLKSNTTILSVPAIVTSHGKQAKFFDGETRPVVTGSTNTPSATGTATTSSQVTQQQIGTTLTVTPFIGADGIVNLDIVQDVSDVTGTVTVDGNTQYIIGDRQTTSNITAKSGEIYVMGGYQKKTDSKSTSRLGPIPFLGDLFGTRNSDKFHQELIFFLRPTVLTNTPADNEEAMKRVDKLDTKDAIRSQLDPNYVPPKKSVLEKIFSK